MRKISLLLFIPLFLVLSCKKSEVKVDPIVEELDTSEAFKDVVFSSFKTTNSYLFNSQTDINYLGFIANMKSVDDLDFNPFVGVRFVNASFSLTDVGGKVIERNNLNKVILSEYMIAINDLRRNSKHSFLPKINFEIYASSDIVNSNKTDITLVLNTIYYYLNLNSVKDDQFELSPNVNIDEVKAKGAYLSRIGFGQQHIIKISTAENPKKVLTYLKAYLNDLLHNGGKNSMQLSKGLDIKGNDFSIVGGDEDSENLYKTDIMEKIKRIIKKGSEPRAINAPFSGIEFEINHFNKVK